MALLEIRDLNKSFGGIQAVDECSFDVEEGAITGLIGPNGAGKTTVFNLISGVLAPDSGTITFRGEHIGGLPPHQITRKGMNRTFQISRNLEAMTVLENMLVQVQVHGLAHLFRAAAQPAEIERAMHLLEFVGITHLAHQTTRSLSYGQKKLLDFASLLMAEPKIMLLDEPAGGVNPALLESIVARIKELNGQGMTFLIVEHNMELIMSVCHKVVVMAYGKVLAEGAPDIIQKDPAVLKAYLGEKA